MEVVDSNRLPELCDAVTARLQSFNKETSFTEDGLAERLAYETVVRQILDRLNAARFDHIAERPQMIEEWMHFVEANAGIPTKLSEAGEASGFEKGRHLTIRSIRQGWLDPHADHPTPPQPKVKDEPAHSMSAREKDSLRVIAEIRNGSATASRPSAFIARHRIDQSTSDDTDLDWNSIDVGSHIDANAGPDTQTEIAADVRFGDDETPIDVVPDMHDAQPCSPRLIPAAHRNGPTDVNGTGNTSPLTGSASANQLDTGGDYERRINDRDSRPLAPESYEIPLSTALDKFLTAERIRHGDGRANSDVAPMIRFMIDLIGDKTLDALTRGDIKRVNEGLPEIPTRKSIPVEHVGSLHARYLYAKKNGWGQLERLTTTTIKNRYHSGLRRFFSYLKASDFWDGDLPRFNIVTAQNMTPLPRDKFQDSELFELVSQPLFTGCRNQHQLWTEGHVYVQNFIYWGFLISVLTGMRTGEIGNLDIDQIETDGQFVYFNLHPIDASKGRVAVGDAKKMKSSNAARKVPVHPLLINLGLLDRARELAQAGCTRLFPDCVRYENKNGVVSWSRPLTRSFQYLKKRLGWERADLQLYSTRHLMSHWIDVTGIAERTKRRILGHAPIGVGDVYGAKGFLDPAEAKVISEIEPPVVQEMRRILVDARDRALAGELQIVKPWLELDFKKSA
ncbi:MAG: hypothetical protein LAT81_12415 [Oceanicaulis sp.]|nr:hypothetical protein [Oceanicaulis sp.]